MEGENHSEIPFLSLRGYTIFVTKANYSQKAEIPPGCSNSNIDHMDDKKASKRTNCY